ncbi:MAG: endonuclease/exonuclease/phosphatase family protein [Planctomycetota bacterium]|nr:endonuclease/exonuclease/phosphatase family protein [Planctomycetota bacterium]
MSVIRAVLVLCLSLFPGSVVVAQSDLEICSAPGIPFGGDNGTPVSISDSILISQNLLIEDVHVSVDISHAFVADVIVDVTSPSGTTLRLHDGLGGDMDDLRVIFSDEGVANGSTAYDFGCYMQPSNGPLSVFSGQGSAGIWTLNVTDDFPANSDGVLNSWCTEIFTSPVSILPSIDNFSCTPTNDGAVITWANPQAYDSIELTVNGTTLILPGSATTHTLTGYAPLTTLDLSIVGTTTAPGQWVSCAESCSLLTLGGPATQVAVVIDERYDDWSGVSPILDSIGDAVTGGHDLVSLSVADDDESLFVRFEFAGPEVQLDEGDTLILYIDTDSNPSTGLAISGIGADLEWDFGARQGTLWSGGGSFPLGHADIGIVAAPTVSATEFEISLRRSSPMISLGSEIEVLLCDDRPGGDCIPDAGGIVHSLASGQLPPDIEIPLLRESSSDLRIVTYNVLNDNPWGGNGDRHGRQIAAVAADIYCFQEISDHSVAETIDYVETWATAPGGGVWHGAGQADCKIVSRFPILQTWGLSANIAAWIDTTAAWGVPTLVVNAHLPCCSSDAGRQNESDEIIAFVRDQRLAGVLASNPDAPVLFLGDMNFVGLSQQRTTLLSGDIIDEAQWGEDAPPDADGTSLTDTRPRHVVQRQTFTWRNDNGNYLPGLLDYIIYSDSILELRRSFVLFTQDLSTTTLVEHGLQLNDSNGSDHLLVSADFRLVAAESDFRRGDCNADGSLDISDAVSALTALFGNAGPTACEDSCDSNDDGNFDIADAVALLGMLFNGAGDLPPPGPQVCGVDPTIDQLDCESFATCP